MNGESEPYRGTNDVEIEADDKGKRLSVLQLLGEIEHTYRTKWRDVYAQAELNTRFISGRQNVDVNSSNQVTAVSHLRRLPRVKRNLLRNLALTWQALIVKDRPTVKAWANEASRSDVADASISNALLDHWWNVLRIDDVIRHAAWNVQEAGTVAFRIHWDKAKPARMRPLPVIDELGVPVVDEAGQVVMQEQEVQGDVAVDLHRLNSFVTDGAERIDDAKWCAFRMILDEHDARAQLREAGVDGDVDCDKHESVWGTEVEGVEAWEIWHRPSTRIKNGLYARVIGGAVVEAGAFPYEHGELPVAVWKCLDREDCPFGDTHVSDAIDLQRRLNDALSSVASFAKQYAEGTKALVPQALAETWEDAESGVVSAPDPTWAQAIKYISPPEPPKVIFDLINLYMEAIPDVFGVNDAVAGGQSATMSKAARQLAYIAELDGQKRAMPRLNLGECLVRMARQMLKLAQQYVTVPRLLDVTGPQGQIDVISFIGADIDGTDVRIEQASGIDRLRASTAAEGEQTGNAEMANTGLTESIDVGDARLRVQAQIQEALRGGQPMADPAIQPEVAVEELRQAIGAFGPAYPQALPALQALEAAYSQMAAEAAQEPIQEPNAAPQAAQEAQAPMGLEGVM